GNERGAGADDEKDEADEAELRERLEVEAVRISHLEPRGSMRQPVRLEGAGTRAEERMRASVVESGAEEIRAAVPGEAEEALAQVDRRLRRRSRKRMPGALSERCRPAGAREPGAGPDEREHHEDRRIAPLHL